MGAITAKAVIQQNKLFKHLPDSTIDKLTVISQRKSFPKNKVIFLQGDEGDAFYGVISGQVRISAATEDGQEIHLNLLESGDSFGEIAILDGQPRTAGATAVRPTDVIVIERRAFLNLLETEPQLPILLLMLFCKNFRWTSEQVEDAAFLDVPKRLAKRLLDLSRRHGTQTDKGIELSISQHELATYLSISRQIVNHHLQEWHGHRWVDLSRGKILVNNTEALSRFVTTGELD